MVTIQENFYCGRIRLFKWNEKLFKKKVSDSEGLALFLITSSFKTLIKPRMKLGDEIELVENYCPIVVPFNLSDLVSRKENLGPNLVQAAQQFLPKTVESLGEQISNYLFRRFQIDPITIIQPNSAKTVIVVEVVRVRMIFFDNAEHSKVGISQFLPPENQTPRWNSKDTNEENQDEDEDEDAQDDEYDPWDSYSNDIRTYLRSLKSYLSIRSWKTRRPISSDEPRGFVEIMPVVLGKRKEEFDRGVDTCAICLDGFVGVDDAKISITSCFHVFHRRCISTWLLKKNCCPTCRLVLPLGFEIL